MFRRRSTLTVINPRVELFEHAATRYADQPAFVIMGSRMTFRKLEERSRAFAAYLQQGWDSKKATVWR